MLKAIQSGLVAAGVISTSAAGSMAAGYTQTVQSTPGLLAYYQFSGNYNSSVGGCTGTPTTGASIGAVGTGPALADQPNNRPLQLNGTDGNEVQSSLTSGVSTAGSIVTFINLAQLPSSAGRTFYIAGQSAVGDDFDLQIQTNNQLYFYTDSGGATVAPTAFTASDLNQWISVAATFTANGARNLYLNGNLVATSTAGGHSDSGNPFTIGYSNVFSNRAFNGGIDEVAFYNTALSATQVSAIYASRTSVPEPASLGLLVLAGGLAGRRPTRRS